LFFLFIGIIATLYSFLSITDIEFYKELGTHLNILSWQPNVLSREFWQFVWVEYPVIYYLFSITTISYLWYKLLTKIIQKQKPLTIEPSAEDDKNQLLKILRSIGWAEGQAFREIRPGSDEHCHLFSSLHFIPALVEAFFQVSN
jgi:hypothetical protein